MKKAKETEWKAFVEKSQHLSKEEPLCERIDLVRFEEELKRLNNQTV